MGRLALDDAKCRARHRHGHAEGAGALPLAFGAMAGNDGQRLGIDLIAYGAALAAAGERQLHAFSPPSLVMYFHSSGVTGWTDRREFLTRTIFDKVGSALIWAKVTGVGSFSTAVTSTM